MVGDHNLHTEEVLVRPNRDFEWGTLLLLQQFHPFLPSHFWLVAFESSFCRWILYGFKPKPSFIIPLSDQSKIFIFFFYHFLHASSWISPLSSSLWLQLLSWYQVNEFFLELDILGLFAPFKTSLTHLKQFFSPNIQQFYHLTFFMLTIFKCNNLDCLKPYAIFEIIFTMMYISIYA